MASVSLDPSVHYTTQGSRYEMLVRRGPLTDRLITKYIKQGWYGRQAQARALALEKQQEKRQRRRVFGLSKYDVL